jgi:citrate synthase
MSRTAQLTIDGTSIELPAIVGSEGELGIDIATLRSKTGAITLDPGYGNTGSCESAITFIDGEQGILRYRGYDIAELAERSHFLETSYLVIHGELPDAVALDAFSRRIAEHAALAPSARGHFESFPADAHPMAVLGAMIHAASTHHPEILSRRIEDFDTHAARLIGQTATIAALDHRRSKGLPWIEPDPSLGYTENFLRMMFSPDGREVRLPSPEVVRALDVIFVLHADHEQNCSTSTVRMVASSRASLYASAAAGVSALWGPLHGGANQAVLEMLTEIHAEGDDGTRFLEQVKNKSGNRRLMGFGHRVYKNFDPRALIIKQQCDLVLARLHKADPLLDIAKKLEETALHDDYFVSRKLYPNVDFYSGIIMRAIGIPTEMFTVLFAIGRMPGWIANYKEVMEDKQGKISRPRQIYTGATRRAYVAPDERG